MPESTKNDSYFLVPRLISSGAPEEIRTSDIDSIADERSSD